MNTFLLKSIRYRAEMEVLENKTGSQMNGKNISIYKIIAQKWYIYSLAKRNEIK